MNKELLKSSIKTLLVKANTVLDKNIYSKLVNFSDENKKNLILKNCYFANKTNRPLCQDTGQVLVFLKIPYDFIFGFDFKKVINEAVEETYKEEFYRKSVVKDGIFDRTNRKTNTPAIIYTDFEDRESLQIDVLIKGGGAENMSFVEMFNPTTSPQEIISKLADKIKERVENACPPLFIGIGAGGTMDYASVLSKKALFEGVENEFCEKLKEECNKNICHCEECNDEAIQIQNDFGLPRSHTVARNDKQTVLSIKMKSTSTHIASLPVAVTINCHSNRHASCEIGKNGVIYNFEKYEISNPDLDFSNYKKVNSAQEIRNLKNGDKILLTGVIIGMRDAAHKRLFDQIKNNEKLPFEIKNSIIFYAGPAPKKDGEVIGPVGPTTSKRMDSFAPLLYDMGCIATIGKGNRSKEVYESCKKNNSKYLTAVGGIACLLQSSFKKAEIIAYDDLGTEAIYKYEVENLPLTVEI